ncbi:hypothetical protein RND71_042073 [Anisodus tanguticus]|uniref:Protein kinase domain-containing protein n=1 Tax=Anisodus tanguticus TaxID=243964 RepID=A0AAE1URW6_9SOLA|nr:hypothetical protein RND71_042073 [Anisodus tanguticus]
MVLLMKLMDSKTKYYFTLTMSSCNILYLVPFFIFCSFSLRCNAVQSDIDCLKSIKDSLEDPLNYLATTWKFDNQTEGFICKFTGVQCWHPDENKVLSLSLPDMELVGEFPRGIQNCTSLSSLDLSSNKLYGTIPFDISKLIPFIVDIDLSNNRFSGEIPVNIADCSYLNNLKLENNNLVGQIPPDIGLLGRIKTFNVANNRLTGPVPHFTDATVAAESYANNSGLCGSPLNLCLTPLVKNDHTLFISGFVTGWSIFTLLGMYLFFFCFPCVKKIHLLIKKRTKVMVIDGIKWPQVKEVNNDPKILKLEKIVTRMSFMELSKATSNFSLENEIGKGMLGKVYKALVPNGWTVAIKRLQSYENLEEEFVSEITTLGSLRHPNLVPLIGFCSERDERLLVYKYMPNGSLHEWLHSTYDKARLLDFPLRVKIVVGVAKALAWLHDGGNFHVVHSQGFDAKVMQLLELASNCMKFIPDQRPTMRQVYQTLAAIARMDDQIGDLEIQLHED